MKRNTLVLAIAAIVSNPAQATTDLQPIQVTANKASQSIEDITSNLTVITAKEIDVKRATTLIDILREVPGLQIVDKGGLGSQASLYLRGFSTQRTLILVDGIRYTDPTTPNGEPPIEHLMVSDIERIEIIKGPQSGVWGANASAGVINIITKSATEGTHAHFQVEAGSNDTQTLQAGIKHANEWFDASIHFNRVLSDSITARAPAGSDIDLFENDAYDNSSVTAKLGFNLTDKDRLDFIHTQIDSNKDYDGCGKIWPETCTAQEIANEESLYLNNDFRLSRLAFHHQDEQYDWKISHQQNRIDRKDPNGYTKAFQGKVSETEGLFNYRPESHHLISLGLSHSRYENDRPSDDSYSGKGGFISHTHKLGKTTFNETIRRDGYSEFDGKTTYKIGVKHPLAENLALTANYGTSYNIPTIYNLYDSYAGNPDLSPETTKGWDLGIQYQSASLTVFKNRIEDKIDYDSSIYQYNNLYGTTRIQGAELAYRHSWNAWDLGLNYTYLDTEDPDGNPLAYRAKQTFGWDLNWYANTQLALNLNGQFFGERPKSQYDSQEGTQNFSVWNFRANYQLNKNLTTYAKINNLFDKEYQLIDGYASPERSIFIGLNYKL